MEPAPIFLDGAMGTELGRLGVDLSGREWSARALIDHPELVAHVHATYAEAGATVHTANTFRTKQRDLPSGLDEGWEALTRRAVDIARVSVPKTHRVAGSLSPLEDCYRPDLSPGESGRAEVRQFAHALASAGVDIMLCETFPAIDEALIAAQECAATGVETWVCLTPGPRGNLLSVGDVRLGAREAIERGASAVLVNCVPATRALPFVRGLAEAAEGRVPIGVYANAGEDRDRIGWGAIGEEGARRYADLAREWIAAGASILGGCCGTGPGHVRALTLLGGET